LLPPQAARTATTRMAATQRDTHLNKESCKVIRPPEESYANTGQLPG
jgi:hypothetical protein